MQTLRLKADKQWLTYCHSRWKTMWVKNYVWHHSWFCKWHVLYRPLLTVTQQQQQQQSILHAYNELYTTLYLQIPFCPARLANLSPIIGFLCPQERNNVVINSWCCNKPITIICLYVVYRVKLGIGQGMGPVIGLGWEGWAGLGQDISLRLG